MHNCIYDIATTKWDHWGKEKISHFTLPNSQPQVLTYLEGEWETITLQRLTFHERNEMKLKRFPQKKKKKNLSFFAPSSWSRLQPLYLGLRNAPKYSKRCGPTEIKKTVDWTIKIERSERVIKSGKKKCGPMLQG